MRRVVPTFPIDVAEPSTGLRADGIAHSRPLLLLERTMYREGNTPFTCVFPVRLEGTLDVERLRWALCTLQAKHSLLRCVVERANGRHQFVMQDYPAPIPLRIVERRGEDDWQDEVRREWTVPFGATRDPLVRFVWVRGTGTSELILVAHHCICDGQSGMSLLQECLCACDNPDRERGTQNALITLEDLVPASLREDRCFQRRVQWKMRLLRLGLRLKRTNSAQTRFAITAEQMYFHRWRLDAHTSQSIMDRCKAEDVTVLAAATVAFVQAFRQIRGTSALRKAYAMVNARKFLPHLRPDALFGIAPGVELTLKRILPGERSEGSFWESARAVKMDMTRRIDRLGAGLYKYLVGLETLHDKYDRLVGDTEGTSAVRHLTLSNMGRLDMPTHYRTFTVARAYSPLVMVSPTPANTVVLSSYGGQLEFAIVSDTQSLPRAQAAAIQERAMGLLRTCAGMANSETSTSLDGVRT